MKRKVMSFLVAILLFAPSLTLAAGLVPCGGPGEPVCQACYAVDILNNVLDWLVGILSVVFALIVMTAGFNLVTSSGNTSSKEKAKSMITNAFVGFVIVLAAWLLIDYGMRFLVADPGDTVPFGTWNTVQCVDQPTVRWEATNIDFGLISEESCSPTPGGSTNCSTQVAGCIGRQGIATVNTDDSSRYTVACAFGGSPEINCQQTSATSFDCSAAEEQCRASQGTPTRSVSDSTQHTVICDLPNTSGAGTGSGTCEVVNDPSNACSPSNLSCFGNAQNASQVCNVESRGGNTSARSTSDLCSDGTSFSHGLWQINIIANHHLLPGCDGNAAFNSNPVSGHAEGECIRYTTNSNGFRYCAARDCSVRNQAAYNQCVISATTPANNTSAACSLYRSAGGWAPWRGTAGRCNIR